MLTVIYRPETNQLSPEIERKLWRQLKGAFRINRLIAVPGDFDTMRQALDASEGERVFLEPKGDRTVAWIPEGDIVIVVGNTAESNLAYADQDETYRIDTEGTDDHNHLYGSNAVAIALAIRYGQ